MVLERAKDLAEGVGRFRLLSARRELGLSFEGLVHRRYRCLESMGVNLEKLGRSLHKTNPQCGLTPTELISEARDVHGSGRLCNGKDMLVAIETVLHEDFGIKKSKVKGLDVLLRLAMTRDMMDNWLVVRRIAKWQRATGRIVLRTG